MNSPSQSSFEKSHLPHCVHTKHVYSLLDTPKKEDAYKKLSKHLETCGACNKEFQRFQLKTAATQIYIPKAIMDRDLRESFEREVGELFKVMNLNNRQLLKNNMKKGFRFIDNMGIDFIKHLISKTMFKSYLFALVIFIGLKLFL